MYRVIDYFMFDFKEQLTAKDIADFLNCELIGDPNRKIEKFVSVESLLSCGLKFLINRYSLAGDGNTVIITRKGYSIRSYIDHFGCYNTYLIVDDPKLAFAHVLQKYYQRHKPLQMILANCDIHKTASIEGDVEIKSGVKIQPYVTIGTEGFGHVRDEKGQWVEFPQIGGVIIEKNVEIAAGSNIHRGTLDNTIIKEDTKISTHCNIGHNSIIGKHVFVGGNTNLGGRTKVGDYSFIGMRVVTKPGVKIGSNVIVGMGSVVLNDIPDNVLAYGYPAEVIKNG